MTWDKGGGPLLGLPRGLDHRARRVRLARGQARRLHHRRRRSRAEPPARQAARDPRRRSPTRRRTRCSSSRSRSMRQLRSRRVPALPRRAPVRGAHRDVPEAPQGPLAGHARVLRRPPRDDPPRRALPGQPRALLPAHLGAPPRRQAEDGRGPLRLRRSLRAAPRDGEARDVALAQRRAEPHAPLGAPRVLGRPRVLPLRARAHGDPPRHLRPRAPLLLELPRARQPAAPARVLRPLQERGRDAAVPPRVHVRPCEVRARRRAHRALHGADGRGARHRRAALGRRVLALGHLELPRRRGARRALRGRVHARAAIAAPG